MKFISKQEGFALKAQRQAELVRHSSQFKIHCGGSCAHYGKIPIGCAGCLFNDVFAKSTFLGCGLGFKNVCNANCDHCFTKIGTGSDDRTYGDSFTLPDNWMEIVDSNLGDDDGHGILDALTLSLNKSNEYGIFSFGGEGSEPLFYLEVIERVLAHYREFIEPSIGRTLTYKLYTNGKLLTQEVIDKLVKWGITEVRVNPSAFGFSDEILDNIALACKAFPVVTTEIGVFPKYYDDIYRIMPLLDKMGLSHMSLCQPKYKDMDVLLSNCDLFDDDAICYSASDWVVVDDNGEVERMIRFAIDNNFSFSVLDCNGILMDQDHECQGLGKSLNNVDFKAVINTNI